MSRTAVVWSCAHADPDINNERFDWVGQFIYDLRPDLVIDLGDGADMRSLNTYEERYPKQIVARNYQADIEAYNDSQDRLRWKFRHAKKKKPFWIGLEGNHEYRVKKALSLDPRLEGEKYGVSFRHLQTDHWFDEYHEYKNSAPAIARYCGVDFAHFFASGNRGDATSGIHHAYTVINNRYNSSVCGHSHKRSVHFKDDAGSIGLVVGCLKGGEENWAGQSNSEWWHGLVVLRELDGGRFEPEFVSLKQLEQAYK